MTKLFQISFFISLVAIEYLATTTISIPIVENSWDKLNHFIAFITLYIFMSLGFKKLLIYRKISLLMFFAIQIEIVQSFIPSRCFSLLDIVADAIGLLLGIIILKLMIYRI